MTIVNDCESKVDLPNILFGHPLPFTILAYFEFLYFYYLLQFNNKYFCFIPNVLLFKVVSYIDFYFACSM